MSENEKKKLLEIKDLKIYYPIKGKRDAEGKPAYVKAVDGVTFDVYENETFGLVGESGCGKSTTGRTVVRLNKPTAGSVTFEGHDLFAKMNRQQNMDLTQKIQIIYQDPYSSLDPRFTVGRCIEEPLIVHHMGNKEERLTLPAVSLGFIHAGYMMRMTKASMLEVLGSDYIKMARSKGVREWKIVTKHTFRNALLTVITVVGQGFISALAGAAVVERLFNIPGMGSLMVDSIEKRDYQVIQAITLLIAMLNVFINLIIDLIYGLADPRIRLD